MERTEDLFRPVKGPESRVFAFRLGRLLFFSQLKIFPEAIGFQEQEVQAENTCNVSQTSKNVQVQKKRR